MTPSNAIALRVMRASAAVAHGVNGRA